MKNEKREPRRATSLLADIRYGKNFNDNIASRLRDTEDNNDIEHDYATFKQSIKEASERTLPNIQHVRQKRISQHTLKLIEERRLVRLKSLENGRTANIQYRQLTNRIRKSVQKDKDNWIDGMITKAQIAADKHDSKSFSK